MQHDFILLDRSGSMAGLWVEALNSVNSYVAKLAEDNVDTGVTLVAFDHDQGKLQFDILRDRIIPKTWRPVSSNDAIPRGMTPLNDATARIVALAENGGYDKVAIIIMTDGFENASREISTQAAKALLDRCRAKDWVVLFLGANFDNSVQASVLGASSAHFVNSTVSNMRSTMTNFAASREAYASTGLAATMDISEDEQERAKTDQ